ncbi:hypothetical protein BC941DRAFT_477062 [Chlamydoabsidia padenii]|nr:hypothetical protein BC941DRAFT_477062 [Chlamydoabsidia padenii]
MASLAKFEKANFEKRRAHWAKRDALQEDLVPNLIALAREAIGPQATPALYETLLSKFLHSLLTKKGMVDLHRTIWREVLRQDEWLRAVGPASTGTEDVEPEARYFGPNMDDFLQAIFGVSAALGWATQ